MKRRSDEATKRRSDWRHTRGPSAAFMAGALFLLCAMLHCTASTPTATSLNPFRDLPAVALDGQAHELAYSIAPLGPLSQGQVLRLKVDGTAIDGVLILAEDDQSDQVGDLAGGGPPNTFFDYRVQVAKRYFVFVLFDSQASAVQQRATLTASIGDTGFVPAKSQPVLVVFEDNFLTNPGLVDPVSFTDDERKVLADITPLVRQEIVTRLRAIFTGTPVTLIEEGDPLPAEPVSRLTFLAARELVEDSDVFFDTVVPPLDSQHAACQDRVIFGEVLPRGAMIDVGNHVRDDAAVVYVGSFQGRGMECRTAAINSVNNIVLGLSQTAAHEIGHLVGLYHVPLTDIMNRSPTFAFQRELSFQRGQLLIEGPTGSEVLTTVIQDPGFYFRANFGE